MKISRRFPHHSGEDSSQPSLGSAETSMLCRGMSAISMRRWMRDARPEPTDQNEERNAGENRHAGRMEDAADRPTKTGRQRQQQWRDRISGDVVAMIRLGIER